MTDGKLKPCPFCGGEVDIALMGEDTEERYWMITRGASKRRCTCRVFMESDIFYTSDPVKVWNSAKRSLIKAWNRRAEI